MRISFIGAGRVAHHLAHALRAQHQIVQIYSRSYARAAELAASAGAAAAESIAALDKDIDLLIIAVSDSAIGQLIEAVHPQLPQTLIVHTSGSTDIAALTAVHARAGVFYPLQTFSFEREIEWQHTPLFIEATEKQDLQALSELAASLSQRVYQYSSAQRLSLHLAAVYACNFANYCYDMAKQVVDAAQADFSLLYPLMLETAQKAQTADPYSVQTGPAVRADQNILNMHQAMLKAQHRPDLEAVYALLSEQILARHHPAKQKQNITESD